MLEDTFYFDLPEGKTRSEFDINPSDYTFEEFKKSVEYALKRKFDNDVKRGNKSLKIRSNTVRVDADVVSAFEFRRYTNSKNYDLSYKYHDGIKFFSDSGDSVVNYPRQHGENGNNKNIETNRAYKKAVRILKKVNYELNEAGYIPSFLIECLAWNIPNSVFMHNYTYIDILRDALLHIYRHTKNTHMCDEWGKVSELLYL